MIDELDMTDALEGWISPHTVKTVTTARNSELKEVQVVTPREVHMLVQPARAHQLQVNDVDHSQRYIMAHSYGTVEIGEYVEYRGGDYKVIAADPWNDYGYQYVEGEATNRPLLEPTE